MKRFTVVCERSETITSVRNVPERNEKGRQYRQYFLDLEDLHAGLEIKSKYADWFKNMSTYGFTENEDYMTVSKNLENGGRIIEHFISVDMAKQICMIQRSEKGRQYREYFLELEKAWNTPEQVFARALQMADQTINSLKDRCRFLGGQITEQQKVIEELQPKASYYDMILQCKELIATTVIAKDYGMSAKKFNKMLHDLGVQFNQSGVWMLYAKYQGSGYLKTKTHNYPDAEGVQHSKEHSYWTQKGRLFLYDLLKRNGVLPLVEA